MVSVEISNSQQLSASPESHHGQGNGQNNAMGTSEKKHLTKLSTSSPEAIRVAQAITPNRLANLLIRKGPLAIRLITAQLSIEVPGFDLLSLSKQRRLIMAAMEQGDPENDVVFEKIGWGQWAVRHVDSDYIVTEPNGSLDGDSRMNIHELKEKAKLGWLKKSEGLTGESSGQSGPSGPSGQNTTKPATKPTNRRDSITNSKSNMHNIRVPGEKMESMAHGISESEQDSDDDEDEDMDQISSMRDLRTSYLNDADDNAIDEDSGEDAMDEDGELFKFEADEQGLSIGKFKRSPPLKFANRVPTKFSPPPVLAGNRRKSSSTAATNSVLKNTSLHGINRHQLFNRSRLNSIENLDDYILSSARNSSLSVLSPTVQNSSLPSTSPLGSWNGKSEYLNHQDFPLLSEHIASALQNAGRRKLSFNESSIRSTLSSSLPRVQASVQRPYDDSTNSASTSAVNTVNREKSTTSQDVIASDTDEEDWATMGAETLRSHSVGVGAPTGNKMQSEERSAARALVDLMGM